MQGYHCIWPCVRMSLDMRKINIFESDTRFDKRTSKRSMTCDLEKLIGKSRDPQNKTCKRGASSGISYDFYRERLIKVDILRILHCN